MVGPTSPPTAITKGQATISTPYPLLRRRRDPPNLRSPLDQPSTHQPIDPSTYRPINLSPLHHLRRFRRAGNHFHAVSAFAEEAGSTILILAPSERYLCRKMYSSVKLAPAGRHLDGKGTNPKIQTPISNSLDQKNKCQIPKTDSLLKYRCDF